MGLTILFSLLAALLLRVREMVTCSESEESSERGGVYSALWVAVLDFEWAVFPGVRGVGRSDGMTKPVYGARLATSMIGLKEMPVFCSGNSWSGIGIVLLGFRGGVAMLVFVAYLGSDVCSAFGEVGGSDKGARCPGSNRRRSMSRCFLAFTRSCLLCLAILRGSSVPSLTCPASTPFGCTIADVLARKGGAVFGLESNSRGDGTSGSFLQGAGDRPFGEKLRTIWGPPSAVLYLRMVSAFAVVRTVGDGVDTGCDVTVVLSDAPERIGERGLSW